jgi:hypothetical protein
VSGAEGLQGSSDLWRQGALGDALAQIGRQLTEGNDVTEALMERELHIQLALGWGWG